MQSNRSRTVIAVLAAPPAFAQPAQPAQPVQSPPATRTTAVVFMKDGRLCKSRLQ
jgi:hypothetical protein